MHKNYFLKAIGQWELIFHSQGLFKGVNIVSEAVPVWPVVQYISDIGQYWYTVSGLSLFFIFINK